MKSNQSTLTLALVMSLCDGASKPMRKKIIKKAIAHGQYNAVCLLDKFYSKNKLAAWHVVALDCAKKVKLHCPDLVISKPFIEVVKDKVNSVDAHSLNFEVRECDKELGAILSAGHRK